MYRRRQNQATASKPDSEARRLKPDHAGANYDIAVMYSQIREDEKALPHYKKYLERTKGKNPAMDAEVEAKIRALEGTPEPTASPSPSPSKKPKTKPKFYK